MPRPLRPVLLAGLLALLTACGSGSAGGGADADPATLIPSSATIYVEGAVKPEGDRKAGFLAAAGKILDTQDPEGRIRELFDEATKESGGKDFSYDRDVKPWVGEKAGMYFTDLQADEPEFLGVVAAADADKAQESLDASLARSKGKLRSASHEGVDYKVDADGVAAGVVKGFLVVGDEALFKRAITTEEDESLAVAKRFRDTVRTLDDARIGTAFLDLKALVATAMKADPALRGQLEQFKSVLELDKLAPVGAALLADGDRIAIETASSAKGGGRLLNQLSLLAGNGSTPLVGELPGDAWGAFGTPKLGESAKTLYDTFAGALGGAAIAGQLKSQTGLDLQEDFFSWIGDTAVFVRGEDEPSIEGALVIEATDEEKARKAVPKIVGAISQMSPGSAPRPVKLEGAELAFRAAAPGQPEPVFIALGKGRVTIALGEAAARDALDPPATLGDGDTFKRATDTLGGDAEPSFFLAMDPLLAVLATGDQAKDPDFAKAKPYLDGILALVAGGEEDGDQLRSRFSAALK